MGILNITPDSFYAQSRKQSIDEAMFATEKMLLDGATFIDVGGQSTRPKSDAIIIEEELSRVIPIIEAITLKLPEANVSIDTYNALVAKKAVEAGAIMVNDISGGAIDADMFATVASLNVPYVCMHIKGTPQTMQQYTVYNNIVQELQSYFKSKIQEAETAGIKQIILDIGFGFAKNNEQNFELLKNLQQFSQFDKPILLGVSRKSSIYKTLHITPQEALNGTTVLNTIGVLKGAKILRVHDVKEAVEVVKLCSL